MTNRSGRVRVGFDARAIAFPAGGVRRYAHELFRRLPAAAPDIEFIAIDVPPGVDPPANSSVGPRTIGVPTNLGRAGVALPMAIRQAGLSLFHAPAYTAPLAGRTPIVLTIHDVSYARRPEFYAHDSGAVRQWFYRRSAARAARIITDSAFSRAEIMAAYGIPESRIAVVPLGAGAQFTPGAPDAASLPEGVRPPFVLHVGDLHPRRDVITALRAVLTIRSRAELAAPSLQLVCAGNDLGSAEELRRTGTEARATDSIVLPGRVSDAALLALYRSAVALVYPSLYEGFGLPVLEAMACGLPVIATRAGSVPEVLGDAGVFVGNSDAASMADAIGMLLSSADHRIAMRNRGLARAAGFSWERTTEQTLNVYRECLQAANGQQAGGKP